MILVTALAGCVIGADRYPRPSELTPGWKVDKTRILGVRAEPAEPRPGQAVNFAALIGRPVGSPADEDGVLWLVCAAEDSVGGTCTFPEGDLSTLAPEDLAELGVVGFEPFLPPFYLVPDDFLDELTPDERLEGAYAYVQTTVLPLDALEDPEFELDPAELEASYKRLVVSEAPTPNHNPEVAAFGVEGFGVHPDAVVHLKPLQVYELEAVLAPDAIEAYEFVNGDGVVEDRVEEPYVAWFSTGGELLESVTLYPYLRASFVAPARIGQEGVVSAVVRDRRGGTGWWTQRWVVDAE